MGVEVAAAMEQPGASLSRETELGMAESNQAAGTVPWLQRLCQTCLCCA